MPSFPIDTAQIVAMYMQGILYGMVLITVAYGMRVLLWSRDGQLKSKRSVNWIMVVVTAAMFVIATLEVAFGLQHNLDAFINYHGPGGAKTKFSDISNWVNVMRTADYAGQTMIGDGIMVYRCYVVCGRDWKIALVPAVLWLAEAACGWIVVWIEATQHTEALLNESRLIPYITAFLSLTLALTTMATGIIVYFIMKINGGLASQNVTRVGGNKRLTRVVRILVESGLMYTVSVIIFFATFLAKNNAQYGVSDCVIHIIPISFTLILIRVEQGVASETLTTKWTSAAQTPVALTSLPSRINTSQGSTAVSASSRNDTYKIQVEDAQDEWKNTQSIV